MDSKVLPGVITGRFVGFSVSTLMITQISLV